MKERPPNEDDDVDEQYRRASARDASGPSEPVRRAVLRHAVELAAQRGAQNGPTQGGPTESSPSPNGLGAARGELGPVKHDFNQPAANEARWRPAAYGGLAAAALAGLLIAPRFLPPSTQPSSSSSEAVPSASKKTEAAPTNSMKAAQAPAAEALTAQAPAAEALTAQAPAAEASRALQRYQAIAPHANLAAGASGTSTAVSPAAKDALSASPVGSSDKAAVAQTIKPRAFADEASTNEPQALVGGVPRSTPQAPAIARVQNAPAAAPAEIQPAPPASPPTPYARPPAAAVGGAVSALAAARARAPIDSATALRQAAQSGDTSRLKALLDEQIGVDARDSAGRTALMLAVISGRAQAVDALLARGADPNAADSSGLTPLAAALAANHADIVAALRRAGAR